MIANTDSAKVVQAIPPGLGGYLSSIPAMMRDLPTFLMGLRKEYGPIASWRMGPISWVLVADAAANEQVLVRDYASYKKGSLQGAVADPILRSGLVSAEGENWRQSRRQLQPAFHRTMLTNYAATISRYASDKIGGWQAGGELDLYDELNALTLVIISDLLFGTPTVAAQLGELFDRIQDEIAHRLHLPLPMWIPSPSNLRLRRAMRQVDEITYQLMRERVAEKTNTQERHDLLSILLNATDEDGQPISLEHIRDEMVTFFIAGHETTAAALFWALYLLARHPETLAKLEAELHTVLGGRIPTLTDLPELRYTEQVIMEGMRLYPPALQLSREALCDTEVAGYRIKKGTQLLISPGVTHRDPRYFAQPELFNPDRWTAEMRKSLPKYAYFPFGGGPCVCIGNQFAMMEAELILASIVQKWQLSLTAPDTKIELIQAPTLRPRNPVMVKLARNEVTR